jgi:mannosyltransferase
VSGHPAPVGRRSKLLSSSFWLALVIAAGAALRLFRLGTKSFWLDEAASATLARLEWPAFWNAVIHRQANMALYYFILRGWTKFGSSEFALRSLSVAAGIAAIPTIYLLGKALFGAKAGRIAALLLSVHLFHIRYSQEARAYSLTMLLAVLSSLFFIRSLKRPSPKSCGVYIVVSSLMVYAHVFGIWVLLAQWFALLFLRRYIPWKQFLFCAALICFLVSPLAYCLLFLSDRSQLAWLAAPSVSDLYQLGLDLTGDGGPLLLLAYVALLLVAIAVGVNRMKAQPTIDSWGYWFLLIWLILPIALVLIISLGWPVLEPRFLIVCVPPLLLLVAAALTQVRSQVLFGLVLVVMLELALGSAVSYYQIRGDPARTDNWRDATRFVLSQANAGDAVLFSYSEEKLAFDEYQRQFQMDDSPLHKFPEETDLELLTRRPSRPSAELLGDIAGRYRRVWVITAFLPNRAGRQVDAMLRAHFNKTEDHSFGFVRTDLFTDPIAQRSQSTERH